MVMKSKLESILDQAQKLPTEQRLRLIARLSENVARNAATEEAGKNFWKTKSIGDHAAEQGIVKPQDLSRFLDSKVWPDSEDLEEFLRDLRAQRLPARLADRS